jgi:hypothetical protein
MAAKKTKTQRARLQRPSPTAHAGDHPGETKRGHDGKRWRSEPDKNGVFHWKRVVRTSSTALLDKPVSPDPGVMRARLRQAGIVDTERYLRFETRPQIVNGKWQTRTTLVGLMHVDELRNAVLPAKRKAAVGHPKPGKPGVHKCAHCKKLITGHPVSHHSEGKPSKHYHPHHAKHHKAGGESHEDLLRLVRNLATEAGRGWSDAEIPEDEADYMTRSAREHALDGVRSAGERLWGRAIEAIGTRDYPTARAILHDMRVVEPNWWLPKDAKGKAEKAFQAVLQFEKDHGIYVEGSGEEARTRLVRGGQQWMPSPNDFERRTGHEDEEYGEESDEHDKEARGYGPMAGRGEFERDEDEG